MEEDEDYANWSVDRQFAQTRLPIGRPLLPACNQPKKRNEYSAATEAISMQSSANLVTGKRVRKQANSYTDQGPSTRLPAAKVSRPAPAPAAAQSSSVSSDRSRHPRHDARAAAKAMPSKEKRASEVAARAAEETASLLAMAEQLWANFSWKQRKELAICEFARARAEGCNKRAAAARGGHAAHVNYETARGWVHDFLLNDGKMSASRWGKGVKIPSIFLDEEVILKSHKWWRDRAPKRGEKTEHAHR